MGLVYVKLRSKLGVLNSLQGVERLPHSAYRSLENSNGLLVNLAAHFYF